MAIPTEVDLAFKATEVISILFGGGALFYKFGGMTMKFQQSVDQLKNETTEIKDTLKALANTTGRIDRLEERQLAEGKRLDRLEAKLDDA